MGQTGAPTPGNDVAAQQNKQAMYVLNVNYKNPLREAKHQRELLKDYLCQSRGGIGSAGGQDLRTGDSWQTDPRETPSLLCP